MNEKKPLDWVNIIFLTSTPLIAIFGTSYYAYLYGIHPVEVLTFLILAALVSIGVTGGYHRYYAHRSHECHPLVQIFYLVWGAAAVENAVLDWASDHRYHHKYVDQELDPYNINKGGLYAHILWIFYKDMRGAERFDNSPDLLKDPLVMWQKRNYLLLVGLTTLALPLAIGFAIGRPLGVLLWGGVIRVVVMQHMTFFVNSWAHMIGTKPYSLDNSARDCWWLAFVTSGEGYHNFHHKFPSDYRNGIHWYDWDPTKWWIWTMEKLDFAQRINRTPNFTILRARLDVEGKSVELRIRKFSNGLWERFQDQVKERRAHLNQVMDEYARASAHYMEIKKTASKEMSAEISGKVNARLKECEKKFETASNNWRTLLRHLQQQTA